MVAPLDRGGEPHERCAARPFLPIVFLTSSNTFEQRLEALAAGGDDIISKPYDPVELVALVRAHLRRAAFLERMNARTHPGRARR